MSTQVSGEAEGVTLLEAINAGRVPTPGELSFPQWQAWRRDEGRRPTVARDGRGIRTRDEVALWREVMAALYGEGRADELASEDEGEQALAIRGVSPSEPYSPESAPGSVEGGRGASPRPSSAGSGGGASVVSLRGKLDALYDPTAEDFGAYLMRMGRVINALNSLDAQIPAGMLEKVTRKAELVIELYAEFGELSRGKGVKFLRDKFVATVQDEKLDATERELSVQAIGEIIERLGGRLSSSPDKLFSTPSDDQKSAGASRKGTGSAPSSKVRVPGRPKGNGDSPMQARLAALEMELEALRQEKAGSDAASMASGQEQTLAAALEEQTKVLKEALAGRGKDTSITSVKTDLHWPTLGDERADSRDVSQFYEEFEDVCGLANSCRGMGHREMLLALRARCRGSRLKTYQNMYKAAWKAGEVLSDPGSVYEKIKAKHLMFSESREEREIRIDAEHAALMKGRLTGHQFEPVFEASVAELEAVGLGKTPRELFLSYLRKMPPSLQKEIRADKRIWGEEDRMRGAQTWEEARRVVLEIEQREATNRATANAVYAAAPSASAQNPDPRPNANPQGQGPKPKAKAKPTPVGVTAGDPRKERLCWDFRDHGSCRKGRECPFSHDKELRKKALEQKGKGKGSQDAYPAKGTGKGKGKSKGLANPFAAFTVVTCGPNDPAPKPAVAAAVLAAATRPEQNPKSKADVFTSLDQLPKDWWKVVENERGGYQYKTVTKVLDKMVETLLDGGAGSNHVTEELVVSILNRAAALGLKPGDKGFPIVQFEQWVYPEFVHGIASGSPVPLKGSVVLKVRLQEGPDTDRCVDGHELYVRCKIAAKGTSDWHGLILGGRALDCEARRGLGFRPGPQAHILDTLGVQIPRCEDASSERKDRAYVFRSVVSGVEAGAEDFCEPCTGRKAAVVFSGEEPVQLLPGEGALVPVQVQGKWIPEASECEAVLPIEGKIEVVPGLWNTGGREGMVLVTPRHDEAVLEKGDPVAELRSGLAASTLCECGAVDTVFQSAGPPSKARCKDCGGPRMEVENRKCYACGVEKTKEVHRLQGCRCGRRPRERASQGSKARGYGLLATMVGLISLATGAPSNFAYVARDGREEKSDHWATFPGGWVRVHERPREELFQISSTDFPGEVTAVGQRRVTVGQFLTGEPLKWEDTRSSDPWVFKGRQWVGVPGGIEKMAESTPTDFYYGELRKSLSRRYPEANRFLLDHLVSLEAFLDKSIIFGFSYGVAKAELCSTGGKLLGHLVGRHGTAPDPEQSQAVRDFAPLKEKLHIQQFLGCTNWLRTYLPAEFGHCAKVLSKYQKPGAPFPEGGLGSADTEGCRAVKAIKQMMSKAIELSIFDEAGAIAGLCPLEQIADASGIAVGGTVLQMTRDFSRMKILLTHSRSLTAPQQAWPPLVQEAYAQLEVKRATRKTFGSVRTLCWTDHANLTRSQHIEIGSDVKLVRWVAEILADGSEIRSLSGRSAKLGDGFSRNPKDRDELLQGRTRDLQGLSGHLRGFNLEEYLGGGTEDPTVPVAWAVGDDVLPANGPSDGENSAAVVSGGVSGSEHRATRDGVAEGSLGNHLKVLFVADYANQSDNVLQISQVQEGISRSMPGWKVSTHAVYGAFEDDDGNGSHLDGATAALKGERQVKRARVDMLTSCATVLRSIGYHLPDFVVGMGQGGLIVGLLRFPLMVEVTLQARNLQREEIKKVVSGWAGLKAVWSVNPRMWKVKPSPEIPKEEEVRQVAEILQLGLIKGLAEPPLASLAREPGREVWEHEGRCACGKRAYVFSRCVTCIEKEAAEEFAAAAEERENPTEEKEAEEELVAEDLLAIASAPCSSDELRSCIVHVSLIRKWAAGWFASNGSEGFVELPRGLGVVAGKKWNAGQEFTLPVLPAERKACQYGITWCVNPDASVTTVHNCAEIGRLESISPAWELHEVNWHNHLKLVFGVCTRLWGAATPKLDWKDDFQRLISLLGAPTGVAKWDDGNGTDSIGHRRDLAGKRVLVAFQLQTGGGYWLPITLGRKIKVNESGPKPTIAFLGRSWNWRLILHMRSKFWILPQWAGAEDVQVGALGEQEVIPSREELALEARAGAGIAEFEVTGSLRSLWYDAQKKDASLAGHFRRPGDPFRVASDGLLERSVILETGEKVTAQASRCLADACWQEVSVDCEGPNREDRWGFRYTLTYLDCLSHAVQIEPLRSLTHAEVRRAFARCIFRARTVPTLVRSDRGPEFKNAMMAEFCALMGLGSKQKFAMSMRPCETGSNERMHQEVQKTLHIIIKEVVRGETDEWSELLPLVEYILDNSPGAHGYTPRDLERSWSLSLDLEKDLIRESLQFEPVSEWARKQFETFAKLSTKIKRHWENASAARAKLANRFRRSLDLHIGDRVVWQSPLARPEGAGRVPWKRGLTGPWEITEVRGNRLVLRSVQDPSHRSVEAHAEDCVLVPADVDAEGPNPQAEVLLDDGPPDEAPSLGQRLKGEGEPREFVMQRRGREFVLRIGDVVAYTKGHKVCHFGRVTQVSVDEGMIGVHKYRPVTGSFRVKWVLAFLNEEGAVEENGTRPVIERIKLKEVVTKADISRDGVLAASTSRKLDKAGYRLFEERVASLVQEPGTTDQWNQLGVLLAELFEAEGVPVPMFPILDQEASRLRSWLESHKARKVVFLEIHVDHKGLSAAARRAGFLAAPPLGQNGFSYGRRWDLAREEDRCLVDLLVQWLEPGVVHLGLPSGLHDRSGKGCFSDSDQAILRHAVSVLKEQERKGRFGSLEGPVGSAIFRGKELVELCGSLSVRSDDRKGHWAGAGDKEVVRPSVFCDAYWSSAEVALKGALAASAGSGLVFASSSGSSQGFPDSVAEKRADGGLVDVQIPDPDVNVSSELTTSEREAIEEELVDLSSRMAHLWDGRAKAEQWDEVKSDLSVYRLSGEKVDKDPRREESYRKAVVEGLGFGENVLSKHPDFNADDIAACREVLLRKAAGFWLEGSPRTTVRGVAHDCVPTGPPVSLQPHSLKGESAAWVDERLEEEVHAEAPAHKKSRKRRLVVDYRKVNARVKRSTYYCRKATDVLAQCSGSIFFSFVDAVTGFNQIENTRRAMEVLAIVARSGKFLPVCLTFGPINGPDDFCYVVDRAYEPGRGRKQRFAKEWIAYVDDLTVRTGRVVDGVMMSDEEHDAEIKEAMKRTPVVVGQPAPEALEALGVSPDGLSVAKSKHDEKESDHNHPTRPRSAFAARSASKDIRTFAIFAGRVCVSRPVRVLRTMGGGGGRRNKGWGNKGKQAQRDPRHNWDDLEFLMVKALRHGSCRSKYGGHKLRGKLQQDGWVEVSEVARAFGVQEKDIVDLVTWVEGDGRKKRRAELSRDGKFIRAGQGHSTDSGLTREDFIDDQDLPFGDDTVLVHGTFRDRVVLIGYDGLKAGGGGDMTVNRLFCHWAANAIGKEGQKSGVRSGTDAAAITTVGTLRAHRIGMRLGGDNVVLTDDERRARFSGHEIVGSRLQELPTSDSESSLSIRVIRGPARSAPVDGEGAASSSACEVKQETSTAVKEEESASSGEEDSTSSSSSSTDEEITVEEEPPASAKKEVASPESGAKKEAAPSSSSMEEIEVEEEPSRAGSAFSRPGREEDLPRAGSAFPRSGRGILPENKDETPANKLRGEMTAEELREVWAEPRRHPGQRLIETTLAAAATSELTYQYGSAGGLTSLVEKQQERPTAGGEDELQRRLRVIAGSATVSAAVRKRSGRDEAAGEAQDYGRDVAEASAETSARLAAARASGPTRAPVPNADSRFAAGLRAEEPVRKLKKQLRSRLRAKDHRKGVQLGDAQRRLAAPAAVAPRLAVGAAWNTDDGLGELTYKAGSWVCRLCGTVSPPDANECVGWVSGSQCTGTYDRDCRRLASARPAQSALPAAEKRKAKREAGVTKIEQILKEKSWDCDHCGKGNLSFRFKCYKCSYPRPSQQDSSEEEVRQESEVVRKANEEFLAQKKALKLRGHRKRAGRRHKSEGHKKRERAGSAGSAAGLAFRSPRATRRKRSTKKRRRSGWSVSRKVRNKRAHADNGNGLSANKLGLVIAAFLAPVVRKVQIEIEEIVETSSEAFQVVIAEGG
ncbi:unnamed protein product [Cladocopium goreaui]|uniref:C3H1-type domain-containing protein n=1 Tax=Cladocopium goreaui TaxID=2562237 RepID=A0A9P1DWP3_9DINO|nr:unnamed protein product [Cladocopium goreaui]